MRRRTTFVAALLAVVLAGCGTTTSSPSPVVTPSPTTTPVPSPLSASSAGQAWPSDFPEAFCPVVSSDLAAIQDQLNSIAATANSGDTQGTLDGVTKIASIAGTTRQRLAALPAWPEASPTIAAFSLAFADLEAGAEAAVTGVNANDMATEERGITAIGNAAKSLTAATDLLTDLISQTGLRCP